MNCFEAGTKCLCYDVDGTYIGYYSDDSSDHGSTNENPMPPASVSAADSEGKDPSEGYVLVADTTLVSFDADALAQDSQRQENPSLNILQGHR